jgi:hypothetical protein
MSAAAWEMIFLGRIIAGVRPRRGDGGQGLGRQGTHRNAPLRRCEKCASYGGSRAFGLCRSHQLDPRLQRVQPSNVPVDHPSRFDQRIW